MIGDGLNDILALKKANLGIAMQSGSSATRNVADMVLLNDSYAALAPALTEGKRIINGITNAVYLLLTRSLTYAFAIIGVLMVGLDFPFEPAQAGVTAITVGLPAFFLTWWARPDAQEEPLLPSLVRFVLPVALWSMLIGVALYSTIYFRASTFVANADAATAGRGLAEAMARFEAFTGVTQSDADFATLAARIDAQTTLSVFFSLCALLLILFLEPPIQLFAGWRPVSPDRRPALLALALIALFVAGLYIPTVASYLGFLPPFGPTWRLLLIGLVMWMGGLALLWRKRWVDRLLALEG
jgi:cation-transporting ATPase E